MTITTRTVWIGSLFAGLVGADFGTTLIGLMAGGVEGHPFGLAAVIVVKSAGVALTWALIATQPARWQPLAAVPMTLALLIPVAWNVNQLVALS